MSKTATEKGFYVIKTNNGTVAKFFYGRPEAYICGPFLDVADAFNAFLAMA